MKIILVTISLWIIVLTGCGRSPFSSSSSSGDSGTGSGSGAAAETEYIYSFEETSGSTAINSGGDTYKGTIYGASRVTGKVGNALQFVSSGSRVEIPMYTHYITFANDSISIDAWINFDSIPVGSISQIVGNGVNGMVSFRFQTNDGKLEMLLDDGYSWKTLILGNQTLLAGTWYHVALTYDGNTATTYINGVLDQSSNTIYQIPTVYNDLYIAASDSAGQNQFLGTIDELRISKNCRTAAEINDYYLLTK